MQSIVTVPPKSQQVATAIRREIVSGRLKQGERLLTVRQFADRFGVSNQVVQSAFGILAKSGLIESHVGRGTFVAESPAPGPAALILDGTTDPHTRFPVLLPGELQRRGMLSCLLDTKITADGHSQDEIRALLESRPRALVVDAYSAFNTKVLAWRDPSTRLVVAKRHEVELVGDDIFYALLDYEQAGYLACRHLLEKGRRRIVVANFERQPGWTSDLVARGYERAMAEQGLRPSSLNVFTATFLPAVLAEAAAGETPDGIVCFADFVYRNIVQATAKLGLVPGKDFDAVGQGNTPWAEAFGIASVDLREDKLAVEVARHLATSATAGRIVIEPELRIR